MRFFGQTRIVQGRQDAPHLVVHQRNHAVVIGNDVAQLCITLLSAMREYSSRTFRLSGVPPGVFSSAALCHHGRLSKSLRRCAGRSTSSGRCIQHQGAGASKGWCGSAIETQAQNGLYWLLLLHRRLAAEAVLALAMYVHRAIAHPGAVVPSRGQGAVVRLRSLGLRVQSLAVQGVFHVHPSHRGGTSVRNASRRGWARAASSCAPVASIRPVQNPCKDRSNRLQTDGNLECSRSVRLGDWRRNGCSRNAPCR